MERGGVEGLEGGYGGGGRRKGGRGGVGKEVAQGAADQRTPP